MLQRHLLSCVLIVIIGLVGIGNWTASRLHEAVETEVGHRAATVLESMLLNHAKDLAGDTLSPELARVIDGYFYGISRSLGIAEMKIWTPGGKVIYASRPGMTGRAFPISPSLSAALAGKIMVDVGSAFHAELSRQDVDVGPRLFEIYVPIRIYDLGQIVAVAEYYQNATVASEALAQARWQTWALIAGVGLLFAAVLFRIFQYSDDVILRQRVDLGARMSELAHLLDRNREAQTRMQNEARRQQEERETQLRQINADIHDGIGQLLTVALLRMKPASPPDGIEEDGTQILRPILEEAMSEVQALLAGTSQPQLPNMPLVEAVTAIVDDHIRRTATSVVTCLEGDLPEITPATKLAICRFVQEGLHNAFKHAGGRDQQVHLQQDGNRLVVAVSNGPSDEPIEALKSRMAPPMGLRSLRHRIERLGGTFQIVDRPDSGMEIRAGFVTDAQEADHD